MVGQRKGRWSSIVWCAVPLLVALLFVSGCDSAKRIAVEVDGARRIVDTQEDTVREALEAEGVALGALDRTQPALWEPTTDGMTIIVTRVREENQVETKVLPFTRQVLRDEALQEGETRMMQLGANGEEEVTYLVTYENDLEVNRIPSARRVTVEPVDEIVVIGVSGTLPSVPISGTVAYLSNGNAWMMRGASGGKRPLTFTGDLDQRILTLSPDGTQLLYTRKTESAEGEEGGLNSLWVVGTVVVGDEPLSLGIEDVRYAQWSPDGTRIAYSTAQRINGRPGWRANNDLWIASADGRDAAQILPESSGGIYGWWGSEIAWSPDGRIFAYADADEVGLLDLSTGETQTLLDFPAYLTYGDWVWVPSVSWSPDGRFVVCTAHATSVAESEVAAESPIFDIWVLSVDGQLKLSMAEESGMWASPLWSPAQPMSASEQTSRIAYCVAENPLDSQASKYDLHLMDRDGSNKAKLFPLHGEEGLET
ncbi:MAG TPA: G5 domain-containing protein, partial [Anaerolineae bacterium]|nr:G5 domain-containing protein [Anaerolineae bacterium]